MNEVGIDVATSETLIEIDSQYFRPTEVDVLQGDASKAKERLGLSHRIGFEELLRNMVISDLEVVAREQRGDVE